MTYREGIAVDPGATPTEADYAHGVACPITHGGNRRLYSHQFGWWSCGGCGHLVSTPTVREMQIRDRADDEVTP